MNNFTLHVKWTNEIHVYKYKTQNLDVQCKKKKPKYILMPSKNLKNTLANTTYQELPSSGLWAKSGLTSLHETKFIGTGLPPFIYTFVYGKKWEGSTDNVWPPKSKVLTLEPLNKSLLTPVLQDSRDMVKGNNLWGQDAHSFRREDSCPWRRQD